MPLSGSGYSQTENVRHIDWILFGSIYVSALLVWTMHTLVFWV